MPEREYRFRLEHILESIAGVRGVMAGLSFEGYSASWMARSAVERGVEIISEASRRIPDEVKALEPEIDWRYHWDRQRTAT
jgi:uncharacterized protein with HEPN domain